MYLRSSRENQEEVYRDWWGIIARDYSKVQLEYAEVTGSYNGLYIQDLGGSKTDTMYIRHNIFENIADYAASHRVGILEYEYRY